MDNIMEILGLVGSSLIGLSFIPQTYKTIVEKETKDKMGSVMNLPGGMKLPF